MIPNRAIKTNKNKLKININKKLNNHKHRYILSKIKKNNNKNY